MIDPTTFTNPALRAEFERQHANCPACHPELPPAKRDRLRAVLILGALSFSLAAWIVGIVWVAS